MPDIHPTAVVESKAQLAADVIVGPFAYVGPHVVLGAGCHVMHHASVEGHTTAGKGNRFFPHSVSGQVSQDLKYRGGNCTLIIGDHNDIREHVTLHIGTEEGGGYTRIGNHNLLMVSSHVAHDCIVQDHCILANGVMLAGHIVVEDWAILSGAAAITHYVTIGCHSFTGGLSSVVHDVPPYLVVDGHPAVARGINKIGLKRRGFTEARLEALKTAYRMLYVDTKSRSRQIELVRELYPENEEVHHLLEFLGRTELGKFGRFRESMRGETARREQVDARRRR